MSDQERIEIIKEAVNKVQNENTDKEELDFNTEKDLRELKRIEDEYILS